MSFLKSLLEKIRGNKILLSVFIVLYFLVFIVATEIFLNQIKTVITPSVCLYSIIFALFVFFISLMLFGLTGNAFISGLIPTFILLVFYIVNFYRVYISGHALTPPDFALAKQLGQIMSFTSISLERRVIASVGLMICDWIMLFLLSKPLKTGFKKRMVIFPGSLLLTLCLSFLFSPLYNYNVTASPTIFYKKHGAAMGFFYMLTRDSVDSLVTAGADMTDISGSEYIKNWTPEPYGKETMEKLISVISENTRRTEEINAEKPNIIVIMSEAFIDPTIIDNLNFSEDPVPNLHRLQALDSTVSGHVITPAYGGMTCDTEYEFLTGHLYLNAGAGRTPFLDHDFFIKENDEKSIARVLSRQGYKTIGIHPYTGEFYDRKSIYKKLGFDEFISSEDMPEDAPKKGPFISDDYFTDAIIEQIEKSDKPLFLYGISMENHFDYNYGKYKEGTEITAWSDLLNDELTGGAVALAQGVYDADKALGKLIDYIEKSQKPTIVFFFGDHLPQIATSIVFYQQMQYVGGVDFDSMDEYEMYKMFTTPYIMWANYDMPKNDYKDMSSAFISSVLLEQTGLEKSLYLQFMYDAYDFFHGAKTNLFVGADNSVHLEPTPEISVVLQMQKLLQHDYLGGEGYVNDAQTAIIK